MYSCRCLRVQRQPLPRRCVTFQPVKLALTRADRYLPPLVCVSCRCRRLSLLSFPRPLAATAASLLTSPSRCPVACCRRPRSRRPFSRCSQPQPAAAPAAGARASVAVFQASNESRSVCTVRTAFIRHSVPPNRLFWIFFFYLFLSIIFGISWSTICKVTRQLFPDGQTALCRLPIDLGNSNVFGLRTCSHVPARQSRG
jgi:hypothetical protein